MRDVNGDEIPVITKEGNLIIGLGLISRDERYLLASASNKIHGSAQFLYDVWDMKAREKVASFSLPKGIIDAILNNGNVIYNTILDFSDRADGSSIEIYLFDTKKKEAKNLGRFSLELISPNDFSPDTAKFAYATYTELDANHELKLFDLTTKTTKTLVQSINRNLSSADNWHWSPDGRKIVVDIAKRDDLKREGEVKIGIVDVASASFMQLTAITIDALLPKAANESNRDIVGILPTAWDKEGKGFFIKAEGHIEYNDGTAREVDDIWYYNLENTSIKRLDFLSGKRHVYFANR